MKPNFRFSSVILLLSTPLVIETGKVPDLPSGRAQYQTNNAYVNGYDTGAESFEKAVRNKDNKVKDTLPSMKSSENKSYTYYYKGEDHSRHELSDEKGNIVGSFSYIQGDGVARKVIYKAENGKDFIITGHYLTNRIKVPIKHEFPMGTIFRFKNGHHSVEHQTYGGKKQFTSSTTIPWSGNENSDASYGFSFSTSDHSRKESSDSKGNIVGSYSYLSPDGDLKHVEYEAGAGKGFIAKGNHLPQINTEGYFVSYEEAGQNRQKIVDGNGNVVDFRAADDIKSSSGRPEILDNQQHSMYSNQRFSQHPTAGQEQWNYNSRTYLPPNNYDKSGHVYESQ